MVLTGMCFFFGGLYVFLAPPPLPGVLIGLVQCVSFYTLSSPTFKGVTHEMVLTGMLKNGELVELITLFDMLKLSKMLIF